MQFHKKILPSGIRLITVPIKDSNTVTALILTETGSKYENENQMGMSHFLEHMCFKGTKKRPTAMDISRELDSLGSQSNAFTSHEYTGYYARAQYKALDQIFDVVSDMYLNPTLSADELEKEKNVIVEELNMYEDMPHRNVHDIFMELLYGDQPAGRNIAGTIQSVRSTTAEAMKAYHGRYSAPATVVVISGAFDQNHVEELVGKTFANIPQTAVVPKVKVIESQDKPGLKLKYRKTDQAHLILGLRTFDLFDPRNSTLEVLSQILGGGMSSRLFQSMREERGLGYYVRAGKDTYTDHGYMAVSAGVTTSRVAEAIEVIIAELKKFKDVLVSEEELNRVKQHIIGNMYLELEGSEELASFYGGQEIVRKPILTPAEIEAKIKAVTAADIQKLAQEFFVTKNLNLAIISQHENPEEFEKLLVL